MVSVFDKLKGFWGEKTEKIVPDEYKNYIPEFASSEIQRAMVETLYDPFHDERMGLPYYKSKMQEYGLDLERGVEHFQLKSKLLREGSEEDKEAIKEDIQNIFDDLTRVDPSIATLGTVGTITTNTKLLSSFKYYNGKIPFEYGNLKSLLETFVFEGNWCPILELALDYYSGSEKTPNYLVQNVLNYFFTDSVRYIPMSEMNERKLEESKEPSSLVISDLIGQDNVDKIKSYKESTGEVHDYKEWKERLGSSYVLLEESDCSTLLAMFTLMDIDPDIVREIGFNLLVAKKSEKSKITFLTKLGKRRDSENQGNLLERIVGTLETFGVHSSKEILSWWLSQQNLSSSSLSQESVAVPKSNKYSKNNKIEGTSLEISTSTGKLSRGDLIDKWKNSSLSMKDFSTLSLLLSTVSIFDNEDLLIQSMKSLQEEGNSTDASDHILKEDFHTWSPERLLKHLFFRSPDFPVELLNLVDSLNLNDLTLTERNSLVLVKRFLVKGNFGDFNIQEVLTLYKANLESWKSSKKGEDSLLDPKKLESLDFEETLFGEGKPALKLFTENTEDFYSLLSNNEVLSFITGHLKERVASSRSSIVAMELELLRIAQITGVPVMTEFVNLIKQYNESSR